MIVVIDYGMGNIASIRNALEHLKANFVISRDPEIILKADKIILPGVGSFRKAMEFLNEYKLIDVLNEKVLVRKTPILGICLGMQLLAEIGTEDSKDAQGTKGLGWIKGTVQKITTKKEMRIPHMGFNEIEIRKKSVLMDMIPDRAHFYFVHSYHFKVENSVDVVGVTPYGEDLVAIVENENVYGAQFHPEKSQEVGLKLISNFLQINQHA